MARFYCIFHVLSFELNFLFDRRFPLILGKDRIFLVEKPSTSEVISQKPHRGVENTPPPSAFRVEVDNKYSTVTVS